MKLFIHLLKRDGHEKAGIQILNFEKIVKELHLR